MNRRWASVVFGLVAMVTCGADGPRVQICFLKENLRAGIENAQKAGKGEALFLDGQEAADYLESLNREAMGRRFHGDAVMLLLRNDGSVSLGVVDGPIGCVPGRIPRDVHQRALALARASRA